MSKEMAGLLFPGIDKTPEDYESRYPQRELKEGAVVTRFAPSPTGLLHFGGLFAAFVERMAAKSTGGIFYLRIEDTDKKREVENGVELIIDGLSRFGITIDEGMVSADEERGDYGPYIQSKRNDIYRAYVKSLVEKGLAYPCFMSEEELDAIRSKQEAAKELPGVYGEYAKYRNITPEEAKARIDAGEEYVVRLKSPGFSDKRISFVDVIKGKIEMPENIMDVVLLKKDSTPTYHFAHAVDDHLMRTTHVIRGDEWLSSVPIHLQLFSVCGFKPPKYAHISPIMKEENGGKRKLSKRKDPEAAVGYYAEKGYPAGAVWEYLLTLANSNYEEWRKCNKDKSAADFPFSLKKMGKAGALFDIAKFNDISKTYISTLTAEEVYNLTAAWAKENNPGFYETLTADPDYSKRVLSIERGNKKPRKDIAKWDEVEDYTSYMYPESWSRKRTFPDMDKAAMREILTEYKTVYDPDGACEDWFPAVRELAVKLGYAPTPKAYKQSPEEFRGHVGDVSGVLRAAVTGRLNTPDLCAIMKVLGGDEVMRRLDESIEILQ